ERPHGRGPGPSGVENRRGRGRRRIPVALLELLPGAHRDQIRTQASEVVAVAQVDTGVEVTRGPGAIVAAGRPVREVAQSRRRLEGETCGTRRIEAPFEFVAAVHIAAQELDGADVRRRLYGGSDVASHFR